MEQYDCGYESGGGIQMKCPWRTIEENTRSNNKKTGAKTVNTTIWADCYAGKCPFWEGGLRNECTRIGSDE